MKAYPHDLGHQKQFNIGSEDYIRTIKVLSEIFLLGLFGNNVSFQLEISSTMSHWVTANIKFSA